MSKIKKQDLRERLYVFFDLETCQQSLSETDYLLRNINSNAKVLTCVMASVIVTCTSCWDGRNLLPSCLTFQQIKHTYVGRKSIHMLAEFLCVTLPGLFGREQQIFIFAHNGQRFDFQLLLEALVEGDHCALPRRIMRVGNSYFKLSIGKNITILDSIRFIPMALRTFPTAWGISQLVKGYFPHKMTPIDIDYLPTLPRIPSEDMFHTGSMTRMDYDVFKKWYDEQPKDVPYDLLSQMRMYCEDDVRILMHGVMTFRSLWLDTYGIDPFVRNATLPGAVIEAFRATSLEADIVPITPYNGYGLDKKTSLEEKSVMDYIEETEGLRLKRQVPAGAGYYFDAFYNDQEGNGVVIEYMGCYSHCCETCYPHLDSTTPIRFHSEMGPLTAGMQRRYNAKKRKLVREMGYKLREIWTHDILNNERIKEIKRLYIKNGKVPQVDHRAALCGGRTNSVKLFHECKDDETIQYYDVNGLYPYILMTGEYPISHPEYIYSFPDGDLNHLFMTSNWFGLIECILETPNKLLHPVLPVKVKGKLMFPLCLPCAVRRCKHCDHGSNRHIRGTWYTGEVKYALECGYRIQKINQVEHYPKTRKGIGNPFYRFISECMKKKKDAEGDPVNNIPANPSMRTLHKLVANSFWGKLACRSNHSQAILIRKKEELFKIFGDSTKKITEILDLGNAIRVVCESNEPYISTPPYTSLISAVLVTAQARLELLKYIHSIPENDVLYFDTDSLIFIQHGSRNPLTNIGTQCGQIASELKPGSFITTFASTGPKSYCYIEKTAEDVMKFVCKFKGISLSMRVLEEDLGVQSNMDKMFNFIKQNYTSNDILKQPFHVRQDKIRATKKSELLSEETTKRFGNDYDKRIIVQDYCTVPWGYIHD